MKDYIKKLSAIGAENCAIDPSLYGKYDVKRGLRDINGKGVLAGLTEISDIVSRTDSGEPCEGKLYYRGIDIEDIVSGFSSENRFGFEEVMYLLLFGAMPTSNELTEFCQNLSSLRSLPTSFVRDIIMKSPSKNLMNTLARSVLTLYSYDENPDSLELENILFQSLRLIAQFPLLAVYGYQAYAHYYEGQSLFIHSPDINLSTAENILHLLRADSKYTDLEAKTLDLSLVLHAEHGGGNNSSFTTHVVTSSGTDTYSSVAASLGSLKGPKHGGANIKVVEMFESIKENVHSWTSKDEIADYIVKILNKEAFDKSGLVYGMGHAVYSLSDPRTTVFRSFVGSLANEKGLTEEYELYRTVESVAADIIAEKRKIYKGVSANVDFYSGFVYKMLGLPKELFTPLFAISRIVGWSAHRIEEIVNAGKIIRPAYKSVCEHMDYIKLSDR